MITAATTTMAAALPPPNKEPKELEFSYQLDRRLTGPTSMAVQRMMSSSVGWMSHHSSLFFRSSASS